MTTYEEELRDNFSRMSADELLDRLASGHLTEVAKAIALAELKARGVDPDDPSGTFPFDVDLVPGVLRAHVFFHQIDTQAGPIRCWSYITDGLRSHGQRELIFTLRCEPGESAQDFPRDPFHLFVSINEFAKQGQIVDVGGVSQFGNKNLFAGILRTSTHSHFPASPSRLTALGRSWSRKTRYEQCRTLGYCASRPVLVRQAAISRARLGRTGRALEYLLPRYAETVSCRTFCALEPEECGWWVKTTASR